MMSLHAVCWMRRACSWKVHRKEIDKFELFPLAALTDQWSQNFADKGSVASQMPRAQDDPNPADATVSWCCLSGHSTFFKRSIIGPTLTVLIIGLEFPEKLIKQILSNRYCLLICSWTVRFSSVAQWLIYQPVSIRFTFQVLASSNSRFWLEDYGFVCSSKSNFEK